MPTIKNRPATYTTRAKLTSPKRVTTERCSESELRQSMTSRKLTIDSAGYVHWRTTKKPQR
jgi:hypothetical protein